MITVLIVDDETLFLASLVEGLSKYSKEFQVKTASNGLDALSILDSYNIDLVITDLKMPVMDGFQLIAEMIETYPLIPVIVMTAFGTSSMEEQLTHFGILGFLEKPIDLDALTARIRTYQSMATKGHIQGITLFSFLQLLEIEQKTLSLRVLSGKKEGSLFFAEGRLVHAQYGVYEGEEAACKIVCWENVEIEIIEKFRKVKQTIHNSLTNLLMESARLKDEAEREEKNIEDKDLNFLENAPLITEEYLNNTNSINRSTPTSENTIGKEINMAGNINQTLSELMQVDGAMAMALVDSKSGMALGTIGSGINLELAAAGNSEVMRAKTKTMANLGLKDKIEDILITLGGQYHLIRPLSTHPHLFIYMVLNRVQSNLALARHKLSEAESRLEV
jgi:DNA-binding response OmpR family regulator